MNLRRETLGDELRDFEDFCGLERFLSSWEKTAQYYATRFMLLLGAQCQHGFAADRQVGSSAPYGLESAVFA